MAKNLMRRQSKDTSVKSIEKSKKIEKLLDHQTFDEILKASLRVPAARREVKKQ